MAEQQDSVDPGVASSGTGCVECLAAQGWWVHLRRCALCGHIGCCDSSPGQHATHHFHESGHQVMASFEPGEDWFWDFRHDKDFVGPALVDPQSHPTDQPTPGPEGSVPADWREHIH